MERTTARADGRTAEALVLDLDRYVPFFLNTLSNKLSAGASLLYRRRFRLGIAEWRVVAILGAHPGISANRVCQISGIDKSAVSRGLAALERRGLVAIATDAGDLRRRALTLTEAGAALRARVLAVALERERRLLADITPTERALLLDLLRRMLANLRTVEATLPD